MSKPPLFTYNIGADDARKLKQCEEALAWLATQTGMASMLDFGHGAIVTPTQVVAYAVLKIREKSSVGGRST